MSAVRAVIILTLFLFIFGCVPQYDSGSALSNALREMEENQTKAVAASYKTLSGQFSEKQAAYINKQGKNSIQGQGMLKTRGGDVKTSAGSIAYLYPKTDYTDEMMTALFGNTERGINQVFEVRAKKYKNVIVNLNPNITTYTKKQTCDAQGNFDFSGIPDGTYYVVTNVEWSVPGTYAMGFQGGDLMSKITVKNGSKQRVILTD